MLHIVPILCLIAFIGFVEYRLKKHLDDIDKRLMHLRSIQIDLQNELTNIKNDCKNSNTSNSHK